MGHPSTTTSTFGQTTSLPTVRKAGTYHIALNPPHQPWCAPALCWVYRCGKLVTQARGATEAAAVAEARRNVRNARKAGGL